MKISKVVPVIVAALLLSLPAWAQSANGQQSTSATATASGQQGTSASATTQQDASGTTSSNPNMSATPSGENQSATENSGNSTLRGCLTGGAGTYVLVSDRDGASYTLVGHGSELDKQINHVVEVTGQPISAPPSSQPSSHNSDAGAPAHPSGSNFQVTSVREITDHCPARNPGL